MFCPKCGSQVANGLKFCANCGNPMQASNQNPAPGGAQPGSYVNNNYGRQPGGYQQAQPGMQPQMQPYMNPRMQPQMAPSMPPVNPYNAPKKKSAAPKVLLGILGGAVGVAAIFGVVGVLGGKGNSDPDADKDNTTLVAATTQDTQEDVGVSDQDSLDELSKIIDDSVSALDDFYVIVDQDTDFQTTDEYVAYFNSMKDACENGKTILEEQRAQADELEGLDSAVLEAKNDYFDMIIFALDDLEHAVVFYSEMLPAYEKLIVTPVVDDYDNIEDYYWDLYYWYSDAAEAYQQVTNIPECAKTDWNKVGENLNLTESIVEKEYLADNYGDFLRHFSAQNLATRFSIVQEKALSDAIDSVDYEMNFASEQADASDVLGLEIQEYCKMKQKDREGYVFKNLKHGELVLDYDCVSEIYPSLYNTYDAFAKVGTGCISGSKKIVIEAEIAGLTQKHKETYDIDASYRTIDIKPPALSGDLNLTSAKNAQMTISIYEQDGTTLIESKSFPVTIKSINDMMWYNDEYGTATQDNILCYLTPESASIAQLKRQAITNMDDMTDGLMESMVGYQETGYNHYVTTYLQVAGLMRAMYDSGIRYTMDPFSIDSTNQHILLPEQVLENGTGLCIETSLVMASALQSANMHAFLIFPEGHAQVAVEIWDDGTDEITEGEGEYFLIETTALSADTNNDDLFLDGALLLDDYKATDLPIQYLSAEEWADYIYYECEYIVDCDDSRVLGFTPFSN